MNLLKVEKLNLKYSSTKTFCHNLGFSCAFRQWRAKSHCAQLHGYALEIKLTFTCTKLDKTNWCMDFGALKPIKQFLTDLFDHRTLVAEDDPEYEWFQEAHRLNIINMRPVPHTGCEYFAELVFDEVHHWLLNEGHSPRVTLKQVEVREHGANSAIVENQSS